MAAVGAASLSVPAIAGQVGEHREKKFAMSEARPAALDGAKAMLTSITKAEQVTTTGGRTLYDFKGRNDLGKWVDLFVTADGQVLGTEPEDAHAG